MVEGIRDAADHRQAKAAKHADTPRQRRRLDRQKVWHNFVTPRTEFGVIKRDRAIGYVIVLKRVMV